MTHMLLSLIIPGTALLALAVDVAAAIGWLRRRWWCCAMCPLPASIRTEAGIGSRRLEALTARRARDRLRLAPSVRPPSALVACVADGTLGNEVCADQLPR